MVLLRFRKKEFEAFFGKQLQDDLNAEIHLIRADVLGIQKSLEIGRSGVGRIQLCKRRRDEQKVFQETALCEQLRQR